MQYAVINKNNGLPVLLWKDGEVSGFRIYLEQLNALAEYHEARKDFIGVLFGPGAQRQYLSNPWAAFFLIRELFQGIEWATITGRPPKPEPPPEGAIQ